MQCETYKPKIEKRPYVLYDTYRRLSPYRHDMIEKIKSSKDQSIVLSLLSIRKMIEDASNKEIICQDESFFINLISVMYVLGFRIFKVLNNDYDMYFKIMMNDSSKLGSLSDFYLKRSQTLITYLEKTGEPSYL